MAKKIFYITLELIPILGIAGNTKKITFNATWFYRRETDHTAFETGVFIQPSSMQATNKLLKDVSKVKGLTITQVKDKFNVYEIDSDTYNIHVTVCATNKMLPDSKSEGIIIIT